MREIDLEMNNVNSVMCTRNFLVYRETTMVLRLTSTADYISLPICRIQLQLLS